MMKRLSILAVAAAALMSSAASAQTLRIGLNEDPDVLDPHRARTFVGRIVFTSLCDKLVDITPDLKFVPELATEWSWSDDGKVLSMKLRPGVKFHDGETLNAAAVKANIDRARTLPDSLRKSELTSVESVETVDDMTVAIKLSRPDATLLSQLSDRAGMILSPKAMATAEFGQKPVCSGPIASSSACKMTASYWSASRTIGTPRSTTSSVWCSNRSRIRRCGSPICNPATSTCWSAWRRAMSRT
jgi:peptide/nickel transport system substrate-binding protein